MAGKSDVPDVQHVAKFVPYRVEVCAVAQCRYAQSVGPDVQTVLPIGLRAAEDRKDRHTVDGEQAVTVRDVHRGRLGVSAFAYRCHFRLWILEIHWRTMHIAGFVGTDERCCALLNVIARQRRLPRGVQHVVSSIE